CGCKVAKMSGRGLGHTGGTIDKLESFPGFSTSIPVDLFEKNVNDIGFSIMGQTKELAPADKKLYALRDITATVDNMSLIASSIMSKKLAAGANAIVLDVKTGSGAFMKEYKDSLALAEEMVRIGNGAGRKTIAVISDMDEPLGLAVGNALEVKEAIDTLEGNGPADFTELCMELGSKMLVAGGYAADDKDAKDKLADAIKSGRALNKLAAFVKAQGGDSDYVYHKDKLPKAELLIPVKAEKDGYISKIVCDEVGICSMILGGGRETKEDVIDLSVGIVLTKKVGDKVSTGDEIAVIHANDRNKADECMKRLLKAYSYSDSPVPSKTVIKTVIGL
nr:thymidine phosphorylase [Lachnospiraceae bacterium]